LFQQIRDKQTDYKFKIMTTNQTFIYNVIRNSEVITLSDLKTYFNVSIYQGASCNSEEKNELMNDLKLLIESGDVIKFNDENGLLYRISDESLKNDLEC
jgi:hypothetical protein